MAMVMVLSGFNGIEYLIEDMYSAFDSDIQITPKKGKKMGCDAMLTEDMMKIEGVEHISAFIE